MTEPVARAVSPRRTVRVAVALVAGQVALCVVIGWVTFGPSEPEPQAARVHPLTDQIVLPTPSLTLPALPAAPAPRGVSASTASSSPRASRSSRRPAPRATSEPAAETPQPVIAPGEAPSEPPPDPGLADSPPPSPVAGTQSPAVEDHLCDPEGAEGVTFDGIELRCVRDLDGDLVWQII